MKLKKKILLILIALISCILLNTSNCFAVEGYNSITKKDVPHSIKYYEQIYSYLPEESFNLLIFEIDNKVYLTEYSDSNLTCFDLELSNSTSSNNNFRGEGTSLNYYIFDVIEGSLSLNTSKSGALSVSTIENINYIYCSSAVVEYGNYENIIYESISISPESTTILDKSIKTEDLDGVFNEIIFILPVCILAIIGLIALRKGIDFLRNLLNKA